MGVATESAALGPGLAFRAAFTLGDYDVEVTVREGWWKSAAVTAAFFYGLTVGAWQLWRDR